MPVPEIRGWGGGWGGVLGFFVLKSSRGEFSYLSAVFGRAISDFVFKEQIHSSSRKYLIGNNVNLILPVHVASITGLGGAKGLLE